jgi:hypothetical protein
MLVHDKFCSMQTQFLLQMDLPLHIHTRSCKKSDVMGPSKYVGIKYLFSFLHPYSKGDIGGALASLACVHTYTWNATRSMWMPTYFEGPMTSDFLQDLVCMCKGKSICSKDCVCVEQNLSCTSICGCQGNEECRNRLSHRQGLRPVRYLL